jgi:hypothetical protein
LRAAREQPGFDERAFSADAARLADQELPYFRNKGACGHCGGEGGVGGDEDDAEWLDFRSYVQFKAIARQVPLGA